MLVSERLGFSSDKIKENLSVFVKAINKAKPAAAKGRYTYELGLYLLL